MDGNERERTVRGGARTEDGAGSGGGIGRGRGGGVSSIKVGVPALLAELSLLAGEPVDLVRWQSAGGRLLSLVAPVDRAQLKTAFWESVRASPSQGAWDTPERAVAGFAAGAKGWVASKPRAACSEVDAGLRARLAGGPVAVAALLGEAERTGMVARHHYQSPGRKGLERWTVTDNGCFLASLTPHAPTAPTAHRGYGGKARAQKMAQKGGEAAGLAV
jgi:hypothetical protein